MNDTVEVLRSDFDSLLAERASLSSRVRELEAELAREKEARQHDIKIAVSYETQVASLRSEIETLKRERDEQSADADALMARLNASEALVQQMKRALEVMLRPWSQVRNNDLPHIVKADELVTVEPIPALLMGDIWNARSALSLSGEVMGCSPSPSAHRESASSVEAGREVSSPNLYGPLGYLIIDPGLNEEDWELSNDPSRVKGLVSLSLYALEDPTTYIPTIYSINRAPRENDLSREPAGFGGHPHSPQESGDREGWQDISTAPKDGSWVLLACAGYGEGGNETLVIRGRWDAEFERDGWDEDNDEPIYKGAWTDYVVSDWGMQEYCVLNPTHWMPLPPAPTPSSIRERDHG